MSQPIRPVIAPDDEVITFLVDVDNTLLDNDAVKVRIDREMLALLGPDETRRFWEIYEDVRRTAGHVSVPEALVAWLRAAPPGEDPAVLRDRHQRLARILVGQPYEDFVYPGADEALRHLGRVGRAAVLTEGDPAYQATKVARSGLSPAVGGFVFVCPNKTTYLAEVAAIFPGDRMVLVEDKPDNIDRARAVFQQMNIPFAGIFVRQGKYAARGPAGWNGAEITVDYIGDLASIPERDLRAALGGGITEPAR